MESSYTDMDGPLFVHDSGGTGRPVVLLHGLGGSQADWWRVAATLRADHRVIGIDLPGFGRSRLAGRVSSVDANEQLVYRFLRERLDRPAVLVGTSMSGAIALGVAVRMGHRLGGLVLVNPWLPDVEASGAKAVWAAKLKAVLLGRRGDADAETRTRQFFRLCCAEPDRVPADVAAAVRAAMQAQLDTTEPDAGFRQAAESLVCVLAEPARYRTMVDQVRVPTLLAHGTADRLVPQAVFETMHRVRPDWQRLALPGVGHAPHLEEPRWIAHLIGGWLAQSSPERDSGRDGAADPDGAGMAHRDGLRDDEGVLVAGGVAVALP